MIQSDSGRIVPELACTHTRSVSKNARRPVAKLQLLIFQFANLGYDQDSSSLIAFLDWCTLLIPSSSLALLACIKLNASILWEIPVRDFVQISNSVLSLLKEAAEVGLASYPERLGQLFLVNLAPSEEMHLSLAARTLGLGDAIDSGRLRVLPGDLPKWAPELLEVGGSSTSSPPRFEINKLISSARSLSVYLYPVLEQNVNLVLDASPTPSSLVRRARARYMYPLLPPVLSTSLLLQGH